MRKRAPVITYLLGLVCILCCITVRAEIAVVVHPSNPLVQLEQDDIRRIFLGRVRLFPQSEIGVDVIDLPEANPLFVHFYDEVAGVTPAKLKRQRASYLFSGKGRLPEVLQSEQDVKARVSSDTGAIGYIPVSAVDASVKIVGTVTP